MPGGLRDMRLQAQRRCKDVAAESDAGYVVAAAQIYQKKHVAARADRTVGRRVPQHASGQAGYRKSQRLERVTEKSIVFEAPSTASADHHFFLQRVYIQGDRPAEQWIQILERNRRGMQSVEGFQSIERRGVRASITDAFEVGV